MSIKVTCSSCSSNFNLNDSLEGKKVKCSKCRNIIEVIKDRETKKVKLINKKLIFIFILLLGTGLGYAYKTGLFNNLGSLDKNIAFNSAKEIKKEIADINYMLDFSGSFESNNLGDSKSGSLNFSGLKVYSNNKGLNQRISLGNLSLKVGKKEVFSGSNLDIVSDNEKVYLFLEKGFNEIVKTLGGNYTNTGTIDLLNSSFGTGKYVKIDNSKPLLTAFGKLSQNKLLKEILIGLSTSNPKEYFSKNGIDTKLQKYFKSDKVLDYLFVQGKKDINSGKIPLTLNSNICLDYAPVVLNILDQVKGNSLLSLNNFSNGNLIEKCNKALIQANTFLPMFVQMYKEGDTTLGNFKLSIISGNMLDINMTYKNHILSTAYLSFQNPDKSINLKVKLDNTGKVSSTLKLNYNKNGIILTGSVIDGSGMIDIQGKQQGVFDISGKITIKDYFLDTYNINGKSEFMGMKSTLTASGNLNKGKIYFISKAGEKETAKLDFSYNSNSYNLDIVSDPLSIKSDYKNSVFNLDIKLKDNYSGEQSYKLSYNKGKIDGIINMNTNSVIIKGNYNNLKDFNINVFKQNDKENNNFILKSQIIGLSEIKYIASLKSDGKNIFEANVNIKKSKDKGYHVYDISGNMTDVYHSQIQKARNTVRIINLKTIQSAIEQAYQDNGEYPNKNTIINDINIYLPIIPKDPLGNIVNNGCEFGYIYEVGDDKSGISNQKYKLSSCFESENNIKYKTKNDGGNDNNRLEIGIDLVGDFKEKFFIGNLKDYVNKGGIVTKSNNTKKDGIYFNLKLKIKIGGVEYSIPKNYDEVDVNMNERFILPDYTSAGRTKIDRKTLLIGGVTGLAIGGTVGYISLQGYSVDARNAKRIQDLNNLSASINIKTTMGIPLSSFVVMDKKYEGKKMYVGGVKLVGGVNYFVGTPNYTALGVKPEDFKDPNGEEYKLGVTTLKLGVFELLAFIENGDGTKSAKLNGTYSANNQLILKSGKDYEIIGDNVIKIIPTYINRIQRNDIIGGNKVLKISPDGSEITFQQKFDKKTMFLISDTKGLISIDGSVIKDGDIK